MTGWVSIEATAETGALNVEAGKRQPGPAVRSGLSLPLFDELSDPLAVVHLAAEAEAAGFFVWDHCQRPIIVAVVLTQHRLRVRQQPLADTQEQPPLAVPERSRRVRHEPAYCSLV